MHELAYKIVCMRHACEAHMSEAGLPHYMPKAFETLPDGISGLAHPVHVVRVCDMCMQVFYAFIVDAVLYCMWQAWMLERAEAK